MEKMELSNEELLDVMEEVDKKIRVYYNRILDKAEGDYLLAYVSLFNENKHIEANGGYISARESILRRGALKLAYGALAGIYIQEQGRYELISTKSDGLCYVLKKGESGLEERG